jgi:hypothetical protein
MAEGKPGSEPFFGRVVFRSEITFDPVSTHGVESFLSPLPGLA